MAGESECEKAVRLENLLEIPLKVVKLEDLLHERDSSRLRSCLTPNENQRDSSISSSSSLAAGRICRSASTSPRLRLDEGRLLPRSSSVSCLFDCCEKPSRWRDTKHFSNRARFKATSIRFPDGTSAVIPVMDLDSPNDDDDHKDQNENKADNNAETNYARTESNLEIDERRSKVEQNLESGSATGVEGTSSESSGIGMGSSSTRKLLKVLDKPMRFQDLLEQEQAKRNQTHSSSQSGGAGGDNAITTRGDHDQNLDLEIKKGSVVTAAAGAEDGNDDDETLKLTFYNEGKRESEKEFRMQCVDSISTSGGEIIACGGRTNDVRSFQSAQGLQMTRVMCDNEMQSKSNNNIINNTQIGQQGVWENCGSGLQILRCERRERTRERKNSTPAPAYNRYIDNENGESLQAYLSSSPSQVQRYTGSGREQAIANAGATIQTVPSPTRMPGVPGIKDSVEDWAEQRILRVPTRPYLRKKITYEQPRQPENPPVPTSTPTPEERMPNVGLMVKRFKPALPPVPTFDCGQQQQQQQQQQSNPSQVQSRMEMGTTPTTPYGSGYPQAHQPTQSHIFTSQMESHRRAQPQSHLEVEIIRPPQVSPQQQQLHQQHSAQNYSRVSSQPRNVQIEELVAETASSLSQQDASFNSASYYEWLRRYWDIYQRQGIDWQKIAEYYERYHFYPWDIPRAREVERTVRRSKTPNPNEAYGAIAQQHQQQEQQHQQFQDYSIPTARTSGSITKGIPASATSYVDGRIQQLMSQHHSPPQSQVPQQSSPQSQTQTQLQKEYHYRQQQHQQQQHYNHPQSQSQQFNFQNPGYNMQQQHQSQHQLHSSHEWERGIPRQGQPQVRQYFPRAKKDEYPNEFQNSPVFAQTYNQVAVAAAAAVASASAGKEDQTRMNSNLASVLMSNVNSSNVSGGQYQVQQHQQQPLSQTQPMQHRPSFYQGHAQNATIGGLGNGRQHLPAVPTMRNYGGNETGNYGQLPFVPSNQAPGPSAFRHPGEWSVRQSQTDRNVDVQYAQSQQQAHQRSVIRRLPTAPIISSGGDVMAAPNVGKQQFPPYDGNTFH